MDIFILIIGLIVSSYFDIKKKIIPNQVILLLMSYKIITIVFFVCSKQSELSTYITNFIGLLICGGYFAISALLSKIIGWGDVKLMAVICLFLGVTNGINCMVLSLFLVAVIGSILAFSASKRKKAKGETVSKRKMAVAYAPFVLAATIAVELVL